MNQLTPEQVRLLRIHHQELTEQSVSSDVAQVIRKLCGLQSQELPSANLAIRARTHGITLEDVRQAREVERSIVLTWSMRGTMHLIPSADIGWQMGLFGQHNIRKTERRYRQLGLDEAIRQQALDYMPEILNKHGALTRAEFAEKLAEKGIPVEGQAIHHLVRFGALSGVLCFGAERDGDLTYVLIDDWLDRQAIRQLDEEASLAELTRRYLQAYAPATIKDFVSWSGLGVGQAKAGFKLLGDALVEVEVGGESAWMLREQLEHIGTLKAEQTVRLLPHYDTYLLGHQSRAFMVADEFAKQVHPGGGLIRTCVIADGQAVASWQLVRKRDHVVIQVQPYAMLDSHLIPKIEAEVEDIGRFLNQEAQLAIESSFD